MLCREVVEIRKGPKYLLYPQKRSWENAEEECQKIGGHLASMRSEKENQQVAAMLKENGYNSRVVWIGAKRNSNGNYEWSDGNEMNFTKWDSKFTSECGYISKGGWSREGCYSREPFVCKGSRQKKPGYFTVRLTVRVDPPPYGQLICVFFRRDTFDFCL